MELSFNEQEQQLLRFLKEKFLENGNRPITMYDPSTMHREVMLKFGLDLPQYRDVISRLQHHGIVKAIAIGAPNGHLQIESVVVEIIRQLNERDEQTRAEEKHPNRMDQAKQYFFSKWWFVAIAIALIVVAAIATGGSQLKIILEWFGTRL